MGYKGIVYFTNFTDESEVFDSEERAYDWCMEEMSCFKLGGAIMEANGEDAIYDDPDYDIVEV